MTASDQDSRPTPGTEPCVGCGMQVTAVEGPVHRYMTSAPGCWAMYGERLAILSSSAQLQNARVMCTDAYAVQHPGDDSPQAVQSVAVHLLNLHAYLVAGAAVAPPRLAGHKAAFHWLTPPATPATRTVRDIPLTGSVAELTTAARAWAQAAWQQWDAHHAQIAQWATRFART